MAQESNESSSVNVNENPNLQQVGTLTEEERSTISQLRAVANQMLNQLGQLEVRKSRFILQLENNEANAQKILLGAKERAGISDDAAWQIQEDGSIMVLNSESETSSTGSD